ncbi:MAG: SDR family NAD(P)-dependent oxidoreductase [Nitrospiraceae bacterium]
MRLDGKVVLIAGSSGALGQVIAPACLEAGAKVITVNRRLPSAQIKGIDAMTGDVTDEADTRRLVTDVTQKAGRLDVLINLVGGFAEGRVQETDAMVWQRMLAMNLTSGFLLSRAVLPAMTRQQAGRILHIAAKAAVDPFPGATAYIVAKSGLVALVRTLALELTGSGVTVNGVLPGTIDTPNNRKSIPDANPSQWVKPESIAHLLLFLASDEASQINGALIPVG